MAPGAWDIPPDMLAWAPRYLSRIAVSDDEPRPERLRALRLLMKMQEQSRARINVLQNVQAGGQLQQVIGQVEPGQAAGELAAVRAHLLPLRLAGDEATTEELARRAVAGIVELESGL